MTPTSAVIGPLRAFGLGDRDLKAISDRLEPMHTECWLPAGPNRDRPTPHRDPTAGPDDVKGIVRDCGLGDERARQGWARMIWHLRNAEQVSTDVLRALRGLEARPVSAYAPTELVDAQCGVERLQKALAALQRFYVQWASDDGHLIDVPRAQWLARQLMGERGRPQGSCFAEIEAAMYEAQRVVRQVGSGKSPVACPQCRRLGSIGQPRRGGLCYSCDNRNTRLGTRTRQTKVRAWQRAKAS